MLKPSALGDLSLMINFELSMVTTKIYFIQLIKHIDFNWY